MHHPALRRTLSEILDLVFGIAEISDLSACHTLPNHIIHRNVFLFLLYSQCISSLLKNTNAVYNLSFNIMTLFTNS